MKRLIAFFSWSNNTKRLVEGVNKEINADVIRIERKIPYSSDYNQCAYVEAKEEVDNKIYPEIKHLKVNFDEYDEILLFFPIWWYTFPMPIGTFVKELGGYKGKVILFENSYTNDPQYVRNSFNDIKALNNGLNVENGLFNKTISEHINFLNRKEEK